ncbi:EAL domain-containing protein [Pseudoalteromonas xiamenensis]|uniref:EAL domain-containing protein n=1 Tax=Pseudoalteromonas xiamenensis TaxID=882626 RepID=UPI0035E522A6
MRLTSVFMLLFSLCVALNAFATTNYAQRLTRLSVNEGLSQSVVNNIVQDKLGYVWVGTEQGLNRFDGYQISVINHDVDFSDKPIYLLRALNNGQIFVSTGYSGSYLIDPKTLVSKKIYSGKITPESTLFSPISVVIERGNLLYVGIERQVFTIDLRTLESNFLVALPDTVSLVRSLAFVGNDLLIGSDVGLYKLDTRQHLLNPIQFITAEKADKLNQNVKFLTYDPTLGLLVGTVRGLYVLPFDGVEFKPEHTYTLVADLNIWDYQKTEFGEFIATELGLYEIQRKSKTASKVLSFDGSRYNVTNTSVYDIMVDKNNVMWMASREQGVFYWPLQAKRFINVKSPSHPLASNTIWSIKEIDNQLWMGSDNGLIAVEHDQAVETFFQNNDPKEIFGLNAVVTIASGQYQNLKVLLLETPFGIQVFTPATGDIRNLTEIQTQLKSDDYIRGMYEAEQYIYFASNKNYYQCSKTELQCNPIEGLSEQLSTNSFYKFLAPLPTHPNDLLISTNSKLMRYNTQSHKTFLVYDFGKEDSSKFAVVDSWAADSNGTLWLATSTEGLVAISLETLEQLSEFNEKTGLLTNTIYELQLDSTNALWASTQKGLYRFDLSDRSIKLFSHHNGLPVDEFNSGASAKLKNGNLAFGSTQGVIIFDPSALATKSAQTQIEITELALMSKNKPFAISDSIQLKHDDVGLLIRFSDFDFLDQHNDYYSAKMTGPTNADYHDVKLGKLFFSQLKPGNYQLTLFLKERGSNRELASKSLKISVAHAPYASPLAITAYVVIALALFALWLRQSNKKQQIIKSALTEMTRSQKQTGLALQATNSGIWEVNLATRTIIQQRLIQELGYKDLDDVCNAEIHKDLIHPDDYPAVEQQWFALLNKKEQDAVFEATYRMKASDGQWCWYHDVGRISEFQDGIPIKVSGIYSNITEQKATNMMASILGDAFGQINDWLLILDANLLPIAANSTFCHAFGIAQGQIKDLSIPQFREALGSRNFSSLLKNIKSLQPKGNHREEVTLRTSHNAKHPIQLSINAITKSSEEIEYYVIVLSDLSEQKKTEKEFRFLANYDSLTGLPNRNLMMKRIQKAINVAQNDELVGLLFIDLDKFKPINDSYGHDVGDKLLSAISRRIESILPSGCTLGRQSGDEFLVLFESVKSPEIISELVSALLIALPEKITISGFTVSISASIGVAIYPFDANNAEKLIRHADVAMIHAKQSGRNSFKFFTSAMNDEILRKLKLETSLKNAVKENGFFNHYQPIVNSRNNQVVGVELLMRWEQEGQLISPAEFIPVAEEVGLIEVMTDQALKRAILELKPLLLENRDFYISLNLSAHQVLRANITEHLVAILYEFGIPCSRLRLEITESTLLADKVKAKSALMELNEQGFILLLDDFGTGYSSLTYLSQFPIDIIKIDQGFVRSMEHTPSNKSIVKTITMLANNLGMTCIAEGVESMDHIRYLSQLGINYMQGFYFSKPVSAEILMSDLYIDEVGKKAKAG